MLKVTNAYSVLFWQAVRDKLAELDADLETRLVRASAPVAVQLGGAVDSRNYDDYLARRSEAVLSQVSQQLRIQALLRLLAAQLYRTRLDDGLYVLELELQALWAQASRIQFVLGEPTTEGDAAIAYLRRLLEEYDATSAGARDEKQRLRELSVTIPALSDADARALRQRLAELRTAALHQEEMLQSQRAGTMMALVVPDNLFSLLEDLGVDEAPAPVGAEQPQAQPDIVLPEELTTPTPEVTPEVAPEVAQPQ